MTPHDLDPSRESGQTRQTREPRMAQAPGEPGGSRGPRGPEDPGGPNPWPNPDYPGGEDPTVQPVPSGLTRAVDEADAFSRDARTAVIGLGANLGNRLETLQGAVDALADTPGVRVTAVSPVYETDPWGVPSGSQPDYFNAVVLLRTVLPPLVLLERAHAVEEAFHRVRTERWGPRTIDVDIVTYEGTVSDDPALTLPHPRAHERAFVLAPWYDLDPAAVLPGHGPVADLLAAVGRESVRQRPDVELHLPE